MTVAQFCQKEGVSQPFFYQCKKLRQPPIAAEPKLSESTVQFMPLRLPDVSSDHSDETESTSVWLLPAPPSNCPAVFVSAGN